MRRALLLAPLLVLALPACVTLQAGGIFPPDRDQVYVEYFGNKTFYRDVEFLLTEQVVSEILSRPGLHLSSRDQAEVVLSGRVTRVRQGVLSEDPRRTVTSAATSVTVVIEIRDARSGEILKTKKLTQRGEFVPDLAEDVESARREVFKFLARDIVRELETEF